MHETGSDVMEDGWQREYCYEIVITIHLGGGELSCLGGEAAPHPVSVYLGQCYINKYWAKTFLRNKKRGMPTTILLLCIQNCTLILDGYYRAMHHFVTNEQTWLFQAHRYSCLVI